VGVALAAVFCMLMIYKLNSILSPESRRVYYWIPLDVMILLASGFALGGLFTRMPTLRMPAQVVLGVMVCTNLAALPSHQAVIRHGEQRPQIVEAARIRQCFVGRDAPGAYGLSAAGAYACARVRTRASGRPLDSDVRPGTPLPALYCRNEG
jgi:hypothetical protein